MPEDVLEINRYFALTSNCNTIGQSNDAFLHIRVFFDVKTKRLYFDLFIHLLIKQTMNTFRNHFSMSYENRSIKQSVHVTCGYRIHIKQSVFVHVTCVAVIP